MSNDKADSLDDVIAEMRDFARPFLVRADDCGRLACDVMSMADRLAALQVHCKLNASPPISGAAVPDELLWEPGDLPERDDYREGWNDCRAAMLADQPAKGGV